MTRLTGRVEGTGDAVALTRIVRRHTERLAAAGIGSATQEARTLARYALGVTSSDLIAATDRDVPRARLVRLEQLVDARTRRVPLQHLTGETGFRDLTLRCRPEVFVPRFETELLAGKAADRARAAVAERGEAVVVEPCTGTGAIALSLAHEVAAVRVIATDLSAVAIELARVNLRDVERSPGLASGARVELHRGDLLDPVADELAGAVDVLVANPPYLTEAELAATPPEVREHDPRNALVGDPGGHAMIERLIAVAPRWLRPEGWLLLEVHEHRATTAAERARERGYVDVELDADLTGRDRFLGARWPGPGGRW